MQLALRIGFLILLAAGLGVAATLARSRSIAGEERRLIEQMSALGWLDDAFLSEPVATARMRVLDDMAGSRRLSGLTSTTLSQGVDSILLAPVLAQVDATLQGERTGGETVREVVRLDAFPTHAVLDEDWIFWLLADAASLAAGSGDHDEAARRLGQIFELNARVPAVGIAALQLQLSVESQAVRKIEVALHPDVITRGFDGNEDGPPRSLAIDPVALARRLDPLLAAAANEERFRRAYLMEMADEHELGTWRIQEERRRYTDPTRPVDTLRALQLVLSVEARPGNALPTGFRRTSRGTLVFEDRARGSPERELLQMECTGLAARRGLTQARVALAVAAHHAETGEWPARLGMVAMRMGGAVPVDPHTRQPYLLQRVAGRLLLSCPDAPPPIQLPENGWPSEWLLDGPAR